MAEGHVFPAKQEIKTIKLWSPRKEEFIMAGYYGCRMSNNALQAYRDGEMPISKWDKATIMVEIKREVSVGNLPLQCSMDNLGKLPEKALKELCLKCSSWHHTGMYYRKTNFYVLDADRIGGLTDQKLDEIAYEYGQEQQRMQAQGQREEKWKCAFLKWSGKRNQWKAERIEETGTVKGQWFIRADGTRKKTTAKGFEFIEKIEDKAAVPAKGMEDTPRCRGKEG